MSVNGYNSRVDSDVRADPLSVRVSDANTLNAADVALQFGDGVGMGFVQAEAKRLSGIR